MHNIFRGIFDSELTGVIAPGDFLLCIVCALAAGALLSWCYRKGNRCTKSFGMTLTMLPAMVSVVIMMVNGNVGTGVAVAGAFSLVRFRSAPGSAREIGAIFVAMATGLVIGMGYLAYGILIAGIFGGSQLFLEKMEVSFEDESAKTLHITIPEDLDYTGVFDDLWHQYTSKHQLIQVKTANLGSLYKLTYNLTLKEAEKEKELIDALRCRNGNLEISISRQELRAGEL